MFATTLRRNKEDKIVQRAPKKTNLLDILFDAYSVVGPQLWGLFLLMSVVALGEGFSMTLLLPLLSVIGVDGLVGEGIVQEFVKLVLEATGTSGSVFGALALVLISFLLQASLYILQVWKMAKLQRIYGAYWQIKLFGAFMHAKWGFIAKNKQGLLTNAITQESLRVSAAFMLMSQTISHLIVIFVYLTIAVILSWQVTASLVVLAIFLFLSVRRFSKKNYEIGANITDANSQLMVLANEYISGAKLVKATATEERALRDVRQIVERLRIYHTWATFFPGFTRGFFEFSAIVALCAILVIGHLYLNALVAHMLLILGLFVRLLPRFNALQQNIQLQNSLLPALAVVNDLYAQAEADKEDQVDSETRDPITGSLIIKKMVAGFDSNQIIKGMTLTIPEKGFIGVVGESGAGKSTFVHALLGLCDLQGGDIYIGGNSIKDTAPSVWRSSIGYVPQETILFHRSVKENIKWGSENASDEEMYFAAKRAKAHEFIMALPEGYDTVIGDQGLRLSGGQRQRLGIARALIIRPRFLLLDEATSALDSASERAVLETLEELRLELCIISVAHRLATIRDADSIYVLDDGRILESGKWDDLINQRGELFKLAQKQHMV